MTCLETRGAPTAVLAERHNEASIMQCFVIQPFDHGKFDQRFSDVFKPAIRKAGLEAYRVDRDPTVSIPVQHIENGIRSSLACLAEISTDNPNIWFELGFAICAQKPVVMVCSDERRSSFPFDVQHRSIIRYSTGSNTDFNTLRKQITLRIAAIVRELSHAPDCSELDIAKTKIELAFVQRAQGNERDAHLLEVSAHSAVTKAAEACGYYLAASRFLTNWAKQLRAIGKEADAYRLDNTAYAYKEMVK